MGMDAEMQSSNFLRALPIMIGLTFSLSANARPASSGSASVQVPYVGVIEAVTNGARRPLEHQNVTMRINAGVMTLGSGQAFYELAGAQSPVRIADDKLHFITRSPGTGVDPSTMFTLYRAEIRKKTSGVSK
jgi:hypothetical protein